MQDASFRDPWAGHNPQMESLVKLNDGCLGLRMKISSGERLTMPLGQASFHMNLDRVYTQPRKSQHEGGA